MLDSDRDRGGLLLPCRHTQPFRMKMIDGLRVTTPAEPCCAARDVGILDLVIMGDSALRMTLHSHRPHHHRPPASRVPHSRQVIPMLHARSESPWESVMRVLHRAADIRALVRRTSTISTDSSSAALTCWSRTRRLQDTDGAGHREEDVHADDLARDRLLLASGVQRHGYVIGLLHGGADIIADVDRTLGRDWTAGALRPGSTWSSTRSTVGLDGHGLCGAAPRISPETGQYDRPRRARSRK
jgi:hypothetical protein